MARPLPPLDLLIGFEAAARQLSFSKAGEEIFLTQSAISRQIRKLEEHLGLELFERGHRSLALTEQGRVLFEVVSDSLAQLSDTVESLRKKPLSQGITISTTTAFAALWLVPRLARLRALCPEVALHIEADNRLVDLKQPGIDLAIRYCTRDQAPPDDSVLLSGEEVFPVCSPALLRRNGRKLACVDDLRHHTLLHLADPLNAWPWLQWSTWFKDIGANLPVGDIGFRFSQLDQMIQAATRGHGVALGSSPLVDHLLEEGVLVAPLGERLVSPRSFFLCHGLRRDAQVASFVQWLHAAMARPPWPPEGDDGD
ncbi:LysR substrate-binding domain-containing protein [Jeongeupia chitinilytica]|uniref:LysR family transcriptional regulator n=1 Tax=Jeongeupia chitinilytica TaxID=1041641 RepID=A0ABQ3GY67_9NEIS|nr:LysR substrate-binding domain-containing protein [Jeongeupia chitinilytica]GHD56492.1 LysR family transcriptional regulator [Jeongeupia chitinilytica]